MEGENSHIIIKKVKPVSKDKRGAIFDLIEIPVEHVGFITFSKGALRGKHYHKKSIQYTFVIQGKIELLTKDIRKKNDKLKSRIIKTGYLTIIPPYFVHTYRALKKSIIIDCTTKSREGSGYENDTIRIP